jgi:penicillin-binding protein 2
MAVGLFVLLFARLWFLQVMAGERYATLAEGNAIRTITVEAARGRILDRNGEPLVRNRFALVVSVQPSAMGDRQEEVLGDLAQLLRIEPDELTDRISRSRVSPFRPKPVAIDVPQDVIDYIHENASTRYPGVYAETLPLRSYPHGTRAAHVVGYVGEISAEELELPEYEGYRPGELVGWAGVERTHESVLRGMEGVRRLEVNARGEVLRDLDEVLPVTGADLGLTLDIEAQRITEEALAEGIELARRTQDDRGGPDRPPFFRAPAGAAVVMDPHTGEVLAMASYPTFEPERFVGGVSYRYWGWLQDPENRFPLINRAMQASYPPGSVFKVVSAAAALEEGYLSQTARLPCPGRWSWGDSTYRNWRSRDSGHLNLVEALVQSCDTVFYELARRMWLDEQRQLEERGEARELLSSYSEAWGLGQRLGIDLPGERAGVVPGRAWKQVFWENHREVYCTKAVQLEAGSHAQQVNEDLCHSGSRWRGGDAVNMVIGQGDLQTTPLQVASAFAAVANRGTIYRPQVAREIVRPDGSVERLQPEALATLPASAETLEYIEAGLLGVTRRGGTAGAVFGDFAVPVAGKTGTAELKPKQPFAWFAAYAPATDPRYVVAVLVEEGGGGSQTAAPITRRILEGLLGADMTPLQSGPPTD